jgi:hypothetical protein
VVNEIIKQPELLDGLRYQELNYWEEVKDEITKL